MTQPCLGSASESISRQHAVARLLEEVGAGDREASEALVPLVYDELRVLARRQRRRGRGDETLDTTALIHEAYLRLVDQSAARCTSHLHFLSVASRAMRQILIDNAKRRYAAKREGGGNGSRSARSRACRWTVASRGRRTPRRSSPSRRRSAGSRGTTRCTRASWSAGSTAG